MIVAKVVGTVVATEKHPSYAGQKVLMCQPVAADAGFVEEGDHIIAVDRVQAGVGDTVLILQEGNGIRQLFQEKKLPIRAVIVGIIDDVDLAG